MGFNDPTRLTADHGMLDGVQTALFVLVAYGLCFTGLFAVLVYLSRSDRQMDFVEDLSGLIYAEPLPAVLVVLLLLNLAGLPPLPGFWARLFIITGAVNVPTQPSPDGFVLPDLRFAFLVIAIVLNVVLTGAVTLRLIVVVALGNQRSRPEPVGGQSPLFAAMIVGVVLVMFGLLPGPLVGFIDKIGKTYAAVSSGGRRMSECFPPREIKTVIISKTNSVRQSTFMRTLSTHIQGAKPLSSQSLGETSRRTLPPVALG